MADKIVQIMQYQGISVGNEPLNDNLIPQNALTADTASIAQTAVIAQYADADTSKGTIEERLSSVEKVEGEMTFSITPSSVQINKLIKSGGICIFDLSASLSFTMSSTTPVDIGTIPLSLVPKPSIGNAWNGYAWYYGPSSNAIVAHVIIYTDTGIVSVVTPNPSGTSATGLRFTLGYETN